MAATCGHVGPLDAGTYICARAPHPENPHGHIYEGAPADTHQDGARDE